MDELDKGNISAVLGNQDELGKAELSCATLGLLSNQIKSNKKSYQILTEY